MLAGGLVIEGFAGGDADGPGGGVDDEDPGGVATGDAVGDGVAITVRVDVGEAVADVGHGSAGRYVLVQGHAGIGNDRCVVDRGDDDGHGGRCTVDAAVGADVGDGRGAGEIGGRGEDQLAGNNADGALSRIDAGGLDGQRRAVDIGVIGQHVDGDRSLLGGGGGVGCGDRCIVGRRNGDGHGGRCTVGAAVGADVGDGRGAGEIGGRGEDQLAGNNADGALSRIDAGGLDGQRRAVDIGVIGQHVDGDRSLLGRGGGVGRGDRCIVEWGWSIA